MSVQPTEALREWMAQEYRYSSGKFGEHQTDTLRDMSLSNNASFGGQAASYWYRLRSFDAEPDAEMQRAQMAAKLVNTTRSLWAAIRSLDRRRETHAASDAAWLIDQHFEVHDYHEAKQFAERADFWETPIGLGLTYLEVDISEHGLAPKFRLGQLVRVEQVMTDAASFAVLQFERCLEVTDALPRPGLSSGNVEPWLPAQ